LDNISHKSVESEGNFPDTTNGELSVEIEGQQPRDDGGGGPPVQFTARARNDAPKNTYYYSRGFKALGDPSPSGLARTLAAAPEAEKAAAEWAARTATAWDGRRARGRAGNGPRRRLGLGSSAQDGEIRQSLVADAAAGKGRVTPGNAAAHGFDAISPVLNLSAAAIGFTEERDAAAAMIDAERSVARAIKDKKVLAAADKAAAEFEEEEIAAASAKADAEGVNPEEFTATGGVSPLPPAGGRRSRKRRRTRKKRGGYGPITTGGWFPHNLLLPSQHLGSLGMWWTGGRR
jgi:hypothetical protein